LTEEADSERLSFAIDQYSRGLVSQGKAAEIAGVSRAEFLEELFRRKIPAAQVTLKELREELRRE
jgi:predicted HTH domain antitoxin